MVLVCAGAAHADDTPLGASLEAARSETIPSLVELARSGRREKAVGFQHDVCDVILALDPEHAWARGILKYKRRKGVWHRHRYKRPPDWNTAAAEEGRRKLEALLTGYKDRVLRALAAGPVDGERKRAVLVSLVRLLPKDAQLNQALGRVPFEGRWVHPETKAAATRRQALLALAKDARREALDDLTSFAHEKGWPAAWASLQYRVVGRIPDDVARSACLLMEVASEVCEAVLGESERHRGPKTTYLFTSRADARAFVEGKAKWRKKLDELDHFAAFWLSATERIAYWDAVEETRLSCPRSVVTWALARTFKGHKRGWVTEGISQRLCWYATGNHSPSYGHREQTDTKHAEGATLPERPGDWIPAARRLLEDQGASALTGVLTRRLNAMRGEDVLVAYALAAYLIEARPQQFHDFVAASAKRHDVASYVKETLGAPSVEALVDRLVDWLAEYA